MLLHELRITLETGRVAAALRESAADGVVRQALISVIAALIASNTAQTVRSGFRNNRDIS
jgi:hypothetical protein